MQVLRKYSIFHSIVSIFPRYLARMMQDTVAWVDSRDLSSHSKAWSDTQSRLDFVSSFFLPMEILRKTTE